VAASTISRRGFLGAGFRARRVPLRPPWAAAEARFARQCTRCYECLRACTPGVLKTDDSGLPVVDFSDGPCTFCGRCAVACTAGALRPSAADEAPWTARASISDSCLTRRGVMCTVCREQCPAAAISLRRVVGGVPLPQVETVFCNGCGACVALCPVGSVQVVATDDAQAPREALCT